MKTKQYARYGGRAGLPDGWRSRDDPETLCTIANMPYIRASRLISPLPKAGEGLRRRDIPVQFCK